MASRADEQPVPRGTGHDTPSGPWGDRRDAFWLHLTKEEQDRIIAEEHNRVVLARESLPAFFEYVMREQVARTAIKCLPHQCVGLDFIMHHERSVNSWPVGSSKTFCMAATTLFLLGQDPTLRGAVISATQLQAEKIVDVVADYIQHSSHLRRVFPRLRKSRRSRDPWTQTMITVERPPGIPDASLVAVGVGGALAGARLNWIIVDDILSFDNTLTKESRDKVYQWFGSTVITRLDPKGSRVVVTNTPWHPDDLVHRLENLGWPSLRMDIYGGIQIQDDRQRMTEGHHQWDHAALRPASDSSSEIYYRLRNHDPDPQNLVPLWPEKFPTSVIENKLRAESPSPNEFNRAYMCQTRDDGSAMCKQEYIDICMRLAREMKHFHMVSSYDGPNPTFTGLDLAFGTGTEHDETAFFTFEVLEDSTRRILDIEVGRWDGPTSLEKLFRKQKAYNSVVRVESNGCFVPETMVLTDHGYVAIENIVIGDLVWTHKHRWRPVTEVLRAKAKMLSTVRPKGGIGVRCTMNHWFFMREAGRTPGRRGGHHRPMGDPEWISGGTINRPAYVAIAVPKWPQREPIIEVRAQIHTHKRKARRIVVDEEMALMLGLYMAEGHRGQGQIAFTFNRSETHLAQFADATLARMSPGHRWHQVRDNVRRVYVQDTAFFEVMNFGVGSAKRPPLDWWGWPLSIRLAMVRGWLLGDGCILSRNQMGGWHTTYFSGCSISRDWLLLARATLHEAGYRSAIRLAKRHGTCFIEGRLLHRAPIYTLDLNSDDSKALRSEMTHWVENAHWPRITCGGRRDSASAVVFDEASGWNHGWSRVPESQGEFEPYEADVFNLVVKDDESFVVEDMVVHNAQVLVKQFGLKQDKSLPIKAHTTTQAGKAHPQWGVAGLFLEMSNGAWLIPNTPHGEMHPQIKKFVEACLYYIPSKHTADVLMSAFMAREQARLWGMLAPRKNTNGRNISLQQSILAR